MKILLTGHKGFIGGHLLRDLTKDHCVMAIDRNDPVPPLHSFDWVVHVGANSSTTERDVEKIFQQNLDYSVDLYDQAVYHGVNFQFASSASVYGLGQNFEESAPPDPRTPYAWTKWLFERYTVQNPPSHSHVQIFRYFNVYGAGEDHKGNQASPYHKFAEQARTQGTIKLFENSEGYLRDFVPVQQVVATHRRWLSLNQSGVWNVGTGQPRSFAEVAQQVANQYGCSIQQIPMPADLQASYQRYTCADTRRYQEVWQSPV